MGEYANDYILGAFGVDIGDDIEITRALRRFRCKSCGKRFSVFDSLLAHCKAKGHVPRSPPKENE